MLDAVTRDPAVTLRLLSGSLCGCEFRLFAGRTMIVVTSNSELGCHHHGDLLAENMIFIPSATEKFTFALAIDEGEEISITLTEYAASQQEDGRQYPVLTNQILTVGTLQLALRYADEGFIPLIEQYPLSREVTPAAAGVAAAKRRLSRAGVIVLLLLLVLMVMAWVLWRQSRQAVMLASQWYDESERYEAIAGRDKTLYIVAASPEDAVKARQIQAREGAVKQALVLSRAQISQRLVRWLARGFPRLVVRRVLMDSARQPVAEVSLEQSDLTESLQARTVEAAQAQFPWIDSLTIRAVSDRVISEIAEQGLQQLPVSYTRINQSGRVNFIIDGDLADSEFQRVKTFITNYGRTWYGDPVQFTIAVKNDAMKGKSFKYGDQHYIKLSPQHWYFKK